jgi:predicted enzyme related to lactoylglutathione lyase
VETTLTRTTGTTGTVHWIDHYVTNSEDIPRWAAFHSQAMGAVTLDDPTNRLPGVFQQVGKIRHGAFTAHRPMPATKGVGKGLPRYGYYINKDDIDAHLRRLEAAGEPHSEPVRTSAFGEAGTAIYWQDPDGNQFEFWAPDVLPEGAMTGCSTAGVGRISHGTFESRDLDRTAAFFKEFCELDPIRNADIASDVLALRLKAGGRLVFQKTAELGGRTTGMGMRDVHTALLVHKDSYFANYQRIWKGLPEWDFDPAAGTPIENAETLPARTVLHPSPAGRRFHALTHRADDFIDWDTNLWHFYGGTPVGASLAHYEGHSIEHYIAEWERTHGN